MKRKKLSATSREPEEFARATARARETRETVAGQIAALVVEADAMGGRGATAIRIQQVIEAERRMKQAAQQAAKAREMGLPTGPAVEAGHEARAALRAAVMDLTVEGAKWVCSLDHEERMRQEGGGVARADDDEEPGEEPVAA